MAADWPIQDALYDRLAGFAGLSALVQGVYDYLPQELADVDSEFPYVVIGQIDAEQWDTDDVLGVDSTVVVHTFSRYRGKRQAADIMRQVYLALHRYALPVTGYNLVTCEWDGLSNLMTDPDGLTRHGVQRFRVLLDEAI